MTKEQLEAEAAFAEKAFQRWSHPTPEDRRILHEAIKRGKRFKAISTDEQL